MPTIPRPTVIFFATALLAGHVPGRAAASAPVPAITFSTYLGGPGDDRALAVATDAAGNSYVAGQSTRGGDVRYGFVAKYSPTGALLYVNFLGNGHCNTWATGIAVDAQGSAVVTGAYGYEDQWGYCNNRGVLVARLTPDGSAFVYAWNFGGVGGNDAGNAVAADKAGNAYITGKMFATLTTTPGAFQKDPAGWEDAFVLKLDPAGATLYATYLGGSWKEEGLAIAVDDGGRAHVCGSVSSTDFPVTAGALQGAHPNGTASAFVTVLDPAGSRILYSTYLGGALGENASGIAVDAAGLVYVTGSTNSENFPTTPNAFDRTCGSDGACNPFNDGAHHWFEDAFLVQIDPRKQGAASLLYSTFFGGGVRDLGRAVAVDAQGRVWVAGATNSAQDFPGSGALQDGVRGDYDAFIAAFDLTRGGADSLLFSTPVGGAGYDDASAVAVDAAGNLVVAGFTASTDFPEANPSQSKSGGGYDIFVTRISTAPAPAAVAAHTIAPPTAVGGAALTGTVTLSGPALAPGASVLLTSSNAGVAVTPESVVVPAGAITASYAIRNAYGRRDDQCDRLGSVRRHRPRCVLHAGAARCAVSLGEAGRDCAGRVQHGSGRADRARAQGRRHGVDRCLGPEGYLRLRDGDRCRGTEFRGVDSHEHRGRGRGGDHSLVRGRSEIGDADHRRDGRGTRVGHAQPEHPHSQDRGRRAGDAHRSRSGRRRGGRAGGVGTDGGGTAILRDRPAGQLTATFPVAATVFGIVGRLEISATYQNVTKTAVLTLAETGIATLTLDRTSMPAGNPVTATVTLTGAAPDGTLVLIHSSSFAAVVPPALTIPAGSTKATFSIETKIVERCSIER